jgi:tetratricopeptide (TPR) repeat protein
LSKRKRKRQRKPKIKPGFGWFRRSTVDLDTTFAQADLLIRRNRAKEAVVLLEPLLASHSREANLHYYLGYARAKSGDLWGGLEGYEQAMKLNRSSDYWLPLSSLYLELNLNAHALHAFRQLLKSNQGGPIQNKARDVIASLEQDVSSTADNLQIPVRKMEEGLRLLEEGLRALNRGDYSGSVKVNRRAIKVLGDWPPPHNNLSQALFFDGQPEAAISEARQVLARDPKNLQALSNTIHFLVWTGQNGETQTCWKKLKALTPQEDTERLKMAEAAAILGEDEYVHNLLQPFDQAGAQQGEASDTSPRVQRFLAVAEANLGKHPAATRRLKALQTDVPQVAYLLEALRAKRPGPGWADRFPYFHSTEIIPRSKMEELATVAERQDKVSSKRFRKMIDDFATRFPQIVLMAEKLIWEEDQSEAGISVLEMIATPAAFAALRRFGLSQAGDDEDRLQVLLGLLQAGAIGSDETVQVWSKGEWREMQLQQYEIVDEPEVYYAPEVAVLLNRALKVFKQGDDEQAERLFQRALALEPQAREAYNNLGTIYTHRQEDERARTMFKKALELDPTYVFPRVNLAMFLLDDDDVEGAKAMLAPLAKVKRFQPQEMVFYSYVQAQIFMCEEEYNEALKLLDVALEISPDYEPAQRLKEHLERFTPLLTGFKSMMERQREQNKTRRARLQAKLTTQTPSLAEALALYSKDVLTGMGHVVMPWGGWSALRKAELLQEIVNALQNPDNVTRIIDSLDEEGRTALRRVIKAGGRMAWPEFDALFGNDLDASPYWNWHTAETTMGRLRQRGLLVEATVKGELLIVMPAELFKIMPAILK